MKPSHKCLVKIPKAQEAAMSSDIDTVLSTRTIELGPENKRFFTLYHPQGKGDELLHNESEAS